MPPGLGLGYESSITPGAASPAQAPNLVGDPNSNLLKWSILLSTIGSAINPKQKNVPLELLQIQRQMEAQTNQQNMQQQQLGLAKRRTNLDEQRELFDQISKVMEITIKAGLDDESATNVIKATVSSFPNLAKALGPYMDNFKFSPKTGQIEIKGRDFKEGELPDPISGQPMPAGKYDVAGTLQRGRFVPSKVAPSKEDKEATTVGALYVEAAKRMFPDDTVKQAEAVRDFQRNPEGPQGRVFEIISKGDKATPEEKRIVQEYTSFLARASGARAAGAKEGELSVTGTERYQGTQRDISQARSEGTTAGRPLEATTQAQVAGLGEIERQIGVIKSNFDKEFLGPIKGTETAFEARRQVGSYLGSPIGKKEAVFRQTIKDIGDQLLRARSGAQINEQEYKRMVGLLPRATDEPQVFNAALARFQENVTELLKAKVKIGKTPRGKLGEGGNPVREFDFVPGQGVVPR